MWTDRCIGSQGGEVTLSGWVGKIKGSISRVIYFDVLGLNSLEFRTFRGNDFGELKYRYLAGLGVGHITRKRSEILPTLTL